MPTPDEQPDPAPSRVTSNRRDFLTGRSVKKELEKRGNDLADELAASRKEAAIAGDTVRLSTKAMNCEFSVIMNPGQNQRQVMIASDAIEIVHDLENRLTVYRPNSELLNLNQQMAQAPVAVEPELFELLELSVKIAEETSGAFNPLSRALNSLWRNCRQLSTLPSQAEVDEALQLSEYSQIKFHQDQHEIFSQRPGTGFDLGGMGKGYALDCMEKFLIREELEHFLIHGGHSSILAKGSHQKQGWPVGIRHPQLPHKRLATLMLQDRAFSASGSGVQFFRHQGERYGHIFDPRTGWPVDHMLSVIVTAPNAALADALSTAFYVLDPHETEQYCQNHPEVGVILFPKPLSSSGRLAPQLFNLNEDLLVWH